MIKLDRANNLIRQVNFIGTPTSVWSKKKKKKVHAYSGTACIQEEIRLRSSL